MKAVVDNGPVTSRQMRQFIDKRKVDTSRRNAELWQRAVQDAEAIITMMIARFDPEAIYQWGSILDGAAFSPISDIDIAVEGLGSAERYFALLGAAETMTRFPLDLVELEHVEPEYARLIRNHGRCVYQRKEDDARHDR